ncbi:hypothetical protein KQI63_12830 [bacterium]|nr:hypothetical protein [bacterium]
MIGRFVRVGALLFVLSLGLTPRPATAESDPPTTQDLTPYLDLVREQMDRYPMMNEEDAYKLLFQATRGPGHYGMSYGPVETWLRKEVEGMTVDSTQSDRMVEEIGPHYSRLYLAPYIAAGGSIEALAHAQIESAKSQPDPARLPKVWDELRLSVANYSLHGLDLARFDELTELLKANEWPAIHHSDTYQQNYQPHYRVLTRKQVSLLLAKMNADPRND